MPKIIIRKEIPFAKFMDSNFLLAISSLPKTMISSWGFDVTEPITWFDDYSREIRILTQEQIENQLRSQNMFLEDGRVYYQHDSNCSEKNFTEVNEVGLRTCLDCAGIFDAAGKGVAVTDKRFDEPKAE